MTGTNGAARVNWIYTVVGGLILVASAGFLSSLKTDVADMAKGLNEVRKDVAVMSATLQGLVERDLPTRAEILAWMDRMRLEMEKTTDKNRLLIDSLEEKIKRIDKDK